MVADHVCVVLDEPFTTDFQQLEVGAFEGGVFPYGRMSDENGLDEMGMTLDGSRWVWFFVCLLYTSDAADD